ncbi:hypothetical protein COCON_G00020270 [Conger conger]|uniref:SRCR domain-containing protein n=1 Tax=Conger conger TaxID=82655 RepID=A0A9Q1DWR2_CONCO|nr:hypothetical protein COCON_G00020270 [Conger conger]
MAELDIICSRLSVLCHRKGGEVGRKIKEIMAAIDQDVDFQDAQSQMEKTTMGIDVIKHEGANAADPPEDVGIIVEGVAVLKDLEDVASAIALLFGVIYVLNLSYPSDLRVPIISELRGEGVSIHSAVCAEDGEMSVVPLSLLPAPALYSQQGGSAFGQGEGQVWAEEIQCRGNESQINFCPTAPSQNQSCSHGNDVGLVCSGREDHPHRINPAPMETMWAWCVLSRPHLEPEGEKCDIRAATPSLQVSVSHAHMFTVHTLQVE